MKASLTNEQVDKLMKFTYSKGVRYYDLQIELVDHLANEIQILLEQDSTLNFDQALQISYKKFGLFGFAHLIQEKMLALQQETNRRYSALFRELFTWPKVAFSLVFVGLFYVLFQANLMVFFILVWLSILFKTYLFFQWLVIKRRMKKKISYMDITYNNYFILWLLLFSVSSKYLMQENPAASNLQSMILFVLCTLFILYSFVGYALRRQTMERVKSEFPELLT